MKKVVPFYAGMLIFYSLLILSFILVGSHGKLILANRETLQYFGIAFAFVMTAIVLLIIRNKSINQSINLMAITLNIISLILLVYQINLLYPEKFTPISGFILALHLLGVYFGVLITYRLIFQITHKK